MSTAPHYTLRQLIINTELQLLLMQKVQAEQAEPIVQTPGFETLGMRIQDTLAHIEQRLHNRTNRAN